MRMNNSILLLESIIMGVMITLLTGLINSTPPQLLGAVWYGYPTGWLIKMVVAPQYNPWKFQPGNLIIDIVFWVVVAAIVLLVLRYATSPKSKKRSKR